MASGDIVPKKELVGGEGVHKIKERTNIKEGFQLEFNEEGKKKKRKLVEKPGRWQAGS